MRKVCFFLYRICWRPLIIDLANYEVEIIEAFVAKTLGKQYDINLNKLFQFQSKLERNKEEEEKSTYFCSELIARLYKELKLIDGEKSSASYFPIDFSSKGDLKFSRNGVSLGREQIIAFEKNKW